MIIFETFYLEEENENKKIEYDENDNIIYSYDGKGFEYWQEYNDKDEIIHYWDSMGYEYWCEYDKQYNEILWKNNDRLEIKIDYDEKCIVIHEEIKDRNDRIERWHKYDERGNKISIRKSNGFERKYFYDKNDELIYYEDYIDSRMLYYEYVGYTKEKGNIYLLKYKKLLQIKVVYVIINKRR